MLYESNSFYFYNLFTEIFVKHSKIFNHCHGPLKMTNLEKCKQSSSNPDIPNQSFLQNSLLGVGFSDTKSNFWPKNRIFPTKNFFRQKPTPSTQRQRPFLLPNIFPPKWRSPPQSNLNLFPISQWHKFKRLFQPTGPKSIQRPISFTMQKWLRNELVN